MPAHDIGCLNHCPRGGGGRGWGALALVIVAVVVIAGGYKVRHGIETGVDIGLWVAGGVVGLILASLIAIAIVKITRRVRVARAQRPALPETYAEPAYQITQMGTHRTVRGAIEAPRTEPETDSRQWLGDTDWPERTTAPVPPRENPRTRAPRQEEADDEPRYHSRFR
jgi:hypothetical protein